MERRQYEIMNVQVWFYRLAWIQCWWWYLFIESHFVQGERDFKYYWNLERVWKISPLIAMEYILKSNLGNSIGLDPWDFRSQLHMFPQFYSTFPKERPARKDGQVRNYYAYLSGSLTQKKESKEFGYDGGKLPYEAKCASGGIRKRYWPAKRCKELRRLILVKDNRKDIWK